MIYFIFDRNTYEIQSMVSCNAIEELNFDPRFSAAIEASEALGSLFSRDTESVFIDIVGGNAIARPADPMLITVQGTRVSGIPQGALVTVTGGHILIMTQALPEGED